ncbi:hypothetical protein J6590_025953 [Homalodisca vitripennis]|nr:hypothetical protein J6590_025953 [Homalodisca vitripennis]
MKFHVRYARHGYSFWNSSVVTTLPSVFRKQIQVGPPNVEERSNIWTSTAKRDSAFRDDRLLRRNVAVSCTRHRSRAGLAPPANPGHIRKRLGCGKCVQEKPGSRTSELMNGVAHTELLSQGTVLEWVSSSPGWRAIHFTFAYSDNIGINPLLYPIFYSNACDPGCKPITLPASDIPDLRPKTNCTCSKSTEISPGLLFYSKTVVSPSCVRSLSSVMEMSPTSSSVLWM